MDWNCNRFVYACRGILDCSMIVYNMLVRVKDIKTTNEWHEVDCISSGERWIISIMYFLYYDLFSSFYTVLITFIAMNCVNVLCTLITLGLI